MKKLITILLAVVTAATCCFAFAACTPDEKKTEKTKVGLIALHDDNSTYDKNFIDAFNAACTKKGVEAVLKTNVPESAECTTAANELVEEGCKLVFADSFGHEDHLRVTAAANPEIQFCHATGVSMQNDTTLSNFHNAFASIYEGRFLAGYAAGLKLKEMYAADNTIAKEGVITVGYVGAKAYAEVKSGYTSWLLGVRRAMEGVEGVTTVNMKVTFTDEWYNETKEGNAAKALIDAGCVLISQHADSWGAPKTCETKNVPNVSYNGSTESQCPNTFIVSSRINWVPYMKYMIECVRDGKEIATDWCKGINEGAVELTPINEKVAAPGTAEAIKAAEEQFKAGTLHVFDTSTFTVNGKTLTSYMADVNKDDKNTPDTEVISNGYFHESEKRSAPYFDIKIDGITLLNTAY